MSFLKPKTIYVPTPAEANVAPAPTPPTTPVIASAPAQEKPGPKGGTTFLSAGAIPEQQQRGQKTLLGQ